MYIRFVCCTPLGALFFVDTYTIDTRTRVARPTRRLRTNAAELYPTLSYFPFVFAFLFAVLRRVTWFVQSMQQYILRRLHDLGHMGKKLILGLPLRREEIEAVRNGQKND